MRSIETEIAQTAENGYNCMKNLASIGGGRR